MIVSLNWLKRYVDFDLDAVALARGLTDSLTESEVVEPPWKGVSGVIAARVVTCEPHPDASKLAVCVVDWGAGSSTVVCGAPNVRAGMTSALAPPGAVIAQGRGISEQTIRGRRSHGMLVSAAELGLEESSEGILELPGDIEAGTDLLPLLGLNDELLEIDVQPNRPDCLGMIGVAREVAALVGAGLRLPFVESVEGGAPAGELTSVTIEDTVGCPRYVARVVSDVAIGPSPLWLQTALRAVGARSISNVVDVTNFVMLEYGHPIHAFDYDRLNEHRIVVRRARAGETMTTLDGAKRVLDTEHLLICDGRGPVALAGIMGGEDSEVSDETSNVLLECAWFDPVVVRRGAWKLGLRTEASHRFERGVDPGAMKAVAARACALMSELAGGRVAPGLVDAGPGRREHIDIELRSDRVSSMLGDEVGREQIVAALSRFGFSVSEAADRGSLVVGVPSHRPDVRVEADLIEEVLRAYGYDRVPPEIPFHSVNPPPASDLKARDRVRDAAVRLGLMEVITSCFMSEKVAHRLGDTCRLAEPVRLSNPVNKEMPLLRTSALPALLDVVRHNRNVGEKDIRVFEIGKVFRKTATGYDEGWVAAGAITGQAERQRWDAPPRGIDFFDGKGVVRALTETLDIDTSETSCYDSALFDAGGGLRAAGGDLGIFGMLSRKVLDAWELDDPVFAFEIDLDRLVLLCPEHGVFEELARYPRSRRDAALVLDEQVAAGDVSSAIESAGEPLLVDVQVFDVYRGDQLGQGKKSLALSFTYMSREKTLTDTEVDEAHSRIVGLLVSRFGASLR
ncbi:MAG: phenylalanine--tRNA ligase subunit beta [Candidatus Eisenbacteria bacterium]|nr:phenylalanine--tRNA ligase subunit beta [Candidatus Eisenbacteria bacterium]